MIAMKEPKQHVKRLHDLMIEMTRFANINRLISHSEVDTIPIRPENNSEHSFSLAMTAWYLCQDIPELNQEKVLKIALSHDLVELHAGDTMAVGRTHQQEENKIKREKDAFKQLSKDWFDFKDLLSTIEKYEEKDSKEAQFVYALDKILPLLLNSSHVWESCAERGVAREDFVDFVGSKTKIDPNVHTIWKQLRKMLTKSDDLRE